MNLEKNAQTINGYLLAISVGLMLTACSNIPTKENYVYYEANFLNINQHKEVLEEILNGKAVIPNPQFIISGHEITKGLGFILTTITKKMGKRGASDTQWFSQLTIVGLKYHNSQQGKFSFPSKDAIAFYSSGSMGFIGKSGCFGYAIGGSMDYIVQSEQEIIANLDMKIQTFDPLGFQGECGMINISGKYSFQRSNFE